MAKLAIQKDATSVTVYLFIQNSSVTTGAGLTGLVFNSASLVAYYVRPLGSATAITLATQTVTGAYSSGGFVEVDATNMPGIYRLDLPNAVSATGVNSAVVMLKGATNMAPVTLELQLVSYNPNDAVRIGLTALPNAAAEAAGGLYTRGTGAGQINQDANGRVDTNIAAISTDATAATNLEAEYDGTGFKDYVVRDTVVTATASTVTLSGGASLTDDLYNGMIVFIVSGTGAGQARLISDYVGLTKLASITPNWITTPDGTSIFVVWPWARVDLALWLGSAPNALVSSRVDASVGAMAANVVTASALAADAVDEIWDEAMAEPTAVPAVTGAMRAAVAWLLALSRNKVTQTATTQALRNDADGANIATAAVSDDGVTFTRDEWV